MSDSRAMTEVDRAAWRTWHAAAGRRDIDAALRALYARLDADIAARGPTCWASGRCCKFDAFGHRLYVTTLEIAWFLRQVRDPGGAAVKPDARTVTLPQLGTRLPGACPYQIDGLCSTHTVRPLGCRIFFCQHGTQDWQHDLYERHLADLRALHDRHALPYRYMDWLAGLAEAGAVSDG